MTQVLDVLPGSVGVVIRLLIGALLGVAIIYAALTYRPAEAAPVAPPPAGLAAAADQLGAVERALAAAARSGVAVPVSLTFTEAQVQAAAAAYFPQTFSGATLTDPVVRLRTGRLLLDMTATLSVFRTTANVIAIPGVSAGRPAMHIESATVGGAAVPDQAREAIAAQLAQSIAAGLPPKLTVTAVGVADGSLTITGNANP